QNEGLQIIAPDGSSKPYAYADIDQALAKGEFVMVPYLQYVGNDRLVLSYNYGGMSFMDFVGDGDGNGGDSGNGSGNRSSLDDGSFGNNDDNSFSVSVDDSSPETTKKVYEGSHSSSSSSSSGSSFTNKTVLIDFETANEIAEIPVMQLLAAIADDDTLYILEFDNTLKTFELETGAPANIPEVNFTLASGGMTGGVFSVGGFGKSGNTMAIINNGNLLTLHDGDLLRLSENNEITTLLDKNSFSIGTPNNTPAALHVLEDNSIIINMQEHGMQSRLYKYNWDENATTDSDKNLSIWSLEDNPFVRAVITELRRKYPDSTITYEIAMDGNNAMSASDAIRTLNTRMLAGNGPDILILDGTPAQSYAERGMLLDLTDIIDTSDVFHNLLVPFIESGNMFYIPGQMMIPTLIGDADSLANIQTLNNLVDKVVSGNDSFDPMEGRMSIAHGVAPERRAELFFGDLKQLYDIMWLSSAPAIIDNNRLETVALEKFLEALKAISDKYDLTNIDENGEVSMSMSISSGGSVELPDSLTRYAMQETNMAAYSADNFMLLEYVMNRGNTNVKTANFPGLTQGAWQPVAITAISADTAVPDFAKEFVSTMLSLGVQRINYGAGLPVTRAGVSEQILLFDDLMDASGIAAFEANINSLIESLKIPSTHDSTLAEMMWESVEKLCKGGINVKEAAAEIEQNIKVYLAERAQ
ncbi:MAG: extracellular solute-binding protein, partial [Oscillospiraceae bacterium]|nr:extracellular solute-binding protein [Oscillospiraceae bacterium]